MIDVTWYSPRVERRTAPTSGKRTAMAAGAASGGSERSVTAAEFTPLRARYATLLGEGRPAHASRPGPPRPSPPRRGRRASRQAPAASNARPALREGLVGR